LFSGDVGTSVCYLSIEATEFRCREEQQMKKNAKIKDAARSKKSDKEAVFLKLDASELSKVYGGLRKGTK
jgi:hypothetical protein